jgi:hypothetical protein
LLKQSWMTGTALDALIWLGRQPAFISVKDTTQSLNSAIMGVTEPGPALERQCDFPLLALNVGSPRRRDLSGVGGRPDSPRTFRKRRD